MEKHPRARCMYLKLTEMPPPLRQLRQAEPRGMRSVLLSNSSSHSLRPVERHRNIVASLVSGKKGALIRRVEVFRSAGQQPTNKNARLNSEP